MLDGNGELQRASPESLERDLAAHRVVFHEGHVRGAFPELRLDRSRPLR